MRDIFDISKYIIKNIFTYKLKETKIIVYYDYVRKRIYILINIFNIYKNN